MNAHPSYSAIVAMICYSRIQPSNALTAAYVDDCGAIDVSGDECPETERCPVSPIVVRPRAIQVTHIAVHA